MRQNPCKGCPDAGCGAYHDICDKHLSWKAEQKKEKASLKEVHKIGITDNQFAHRVPKGFKRRKK